jgi:hypothetical protein
MRSIPVCLLKTCDQHLTSHHRREWTYDGHVISILVDDGRTWYKCGDLAQIWEGRSSRQQQNELMTSEIRAVGSSGAKYVTGTAVLHLARAKLDGNALAALFEALGSGTNTVIPGPRKNQPCPFTELEQNSKPRRITQLMDQITYHAGAREKTHVKRRKQRRGQTVVSNDTTQLLVGVLNRFPLDETARIVGLLDESTKSGILPHIIKPFARDIQTTLDTAWFSTKVMCSISDHVYKTQVKPLFGPASQALGLQVTAYSSALVCVCVCVC